MWGPWRAVPPSETVLTFCRLCWGCGIICVLCVSVTAGSLGVSPNTLQQLVHLVLVRLREVCWLLQNVKYRCVCECVWKVQFHTHFCIFWNRKFLTDYCMVWNAHNFVCPAVLSATQTVTQFIIQLLFTFVTQGQVLLCGCSIILGPTEDRIVFHFWYVLVICR